MFVKLLEKEEEHHGVHADPPDERFRVIAVDEQQLECVNHDSQKLQHLKGGQIFLPPQVFLYVGAQCGQQVICVHDNVHKRVQKTEECAVAACVQIMS